MNSPNDVVVKSDGSIYFSDPPYGLTADYGIEGEQDLDFQGVYRLSPDGQTLTLLVDDFDPRMVSASHRTSQFYILTIPNVCTSACLMSSLMALLRMDEFLPKKKATMGCQMA